MYINLILGEMIDNKNWICIDIDWNYMQLIIICYNFDNIIII